MKTRNPPSIPLDKKNTGLDLNLFAPSLIQDTPGLEGALAYLRKKLWTGNQNLALKKLFERPYMFEYVFSAADTVTADLIQESLLGSFPRSAEDFQDSLSALALHRLSIVMVVFSDDTPSATIKFRSVDFALPVLKALASMKFDSGSGDVGAHADEEEKDDFFKLVKTKRGQKQSKLAKRMGRGPVVDPAPFRALLRDVPSTATDAQIMASGILQDLKNTLTGYLEFLRRPSFADAIRQQYITESKDALEAVREAAEGRPDAKEICVDSTTVEAIPAVYPMVQPMKAALYFDSAEGFGEWRLLLSTRACGDLREARKYGKPFGIIIKKLKELSHGHFSEDNQKRLAGSDRDIPIYEAKMTRDSRLVYQVDCLAEFDSEVERQVLRIFGIYTHAQLDKRFWDSMGKQLANKGPEYRRRCTFRNQPTVAGDKVYLPACWPPQLETAASQPTGDPLLRVADLEELHSLLVLEKFVPFSQALLNSIIADQEVSHVFAVSPRERDIIEHNSSCYVIGRSGTGKTTTMLFKMLGIEQAQKAGSHMMVEMQRPRQLFVTQSRVLAGRVEEYFKKLMDSLSTSTKTPEELLQLAHKKAAQDEYELVDVDDDDDWRSDLPKRFSDLEDKHFPLFLTFDKLCKLIEADFNLSFSRQSLTREHRRAERRMNTVANVDNVYLVEESDSEDAVEDIQLCTLEDVKDTPASMVTYDVFRESYWPHFPQNLTKGLDPALVFSEFMGVIKGSEQSLASPCSYLDRNSYTNLSHRTQSTFVSSRADVYSLFEAYMKRKVARADHDVADRTHAILHQLKLKEHISHKVQFLYVDEAQDNLLVDAQLLRYLCENPHGLFWAGDTAQTISIGSSFRFNDLKAFLHRMEEQRVTQARRGQIIVQPRMFQLTMNYRSHGGIVSCADSVIQLITKFWPNSIDILGREKGIVDGLKPVFFTGWDKDTVRYEQFLFGESGKSVEFGAQQCILVRNDEARDKLRSEVGEIGLIMTLYESKGLEFNDVLLFNFFEDSTVDESQWRVILNAVDWRGQEKIQAPHFDDIRHAGVCIELKFLYVAITRARKNLWIVDRSEKAEPMKILLSSKNQVENYTPGTNLPKLAESSTPAEWANSGRLLFQNKRYSQAMHCFDRAGLTHEKSVSNAYYLRSKARTIPMRQGRQNPLRISAFLEAANAFLMCAIASARQKKTYLRAAGDCFVSGENTGKAARAYLEAEQFSLAAQNFRKAGLFDDAVSVIEKHEDKISPDVVDKIIGVARLYYFKERNLEQATKLFGSLEEALVYMDDCGLDVARATLLETMGRRAEAAELYLSEGRKMDAIRLFLADKGESSSTRRAAQCILDGLWEHFSLDVQTAFDDDGFKKLLLLSSQLERGTVLPVEQDELLLFDAINRDDHKALLELARTLYSIHSNLPASILAIDCCLKNPPQIQIASAQETSAHLDTYCNYANLVRKVLYAPNRCGIPHMQRLLRFHRTAENGFQLHSGSLLQLVVSNKRFPTIRSTETGCIVSESTLNTLIGIALENRLRSKVLIENEQCCRARAFSPCLHYTLHFRCGISNCPEEHVDPGRVDLPWFVWRIKIILKQIQFLQTCDYVLLPNQRAHNRRYWLTQLFKAYYPPILHFGNITLAAGLSFPELEAKGRQLIWTWTKDILFSLDPLDRSVPFLSTLLRSAILCAGIDLGKAHDCWLRAPAYASHRPRFLMRREQFYVVHDLLHFVSMESTAFISAGIHFIKFVVESQEPMDMHDICLIVESLCGSITTFVAHRYKGLDGLTLPKSWILSALPKLTAVPSTEVTQIHHLLQSVHTIIGLLYSGTDDAIRNFTWNDRRMSYSGRTISITRLCRALAFLGFNLRDVRYHNEITSIITSLRTLHYGRDFPSAYASYANATEWKCIARAACKSLLNSKLDEVIVLVHTSRQSRPPTTLTGVSRVWFGNFEDLVARINAAVSHSKLTPNAAPFIPPQSVPAGAASAPEPEVLQPNLPHISLDAAHNNGEPPNDDVPPDDVGDIIEDHEDLNEEGDYELDRADNSEGDNAGTNVPPTASAVLPTEEEERAASVLQEHFRALLRRKRLVGKSTLQELRTRHFLACLEAAKGIEWPHRRRRMLFLGFLPHVLVCLEGIQQQMMAAKEKAKKRLTAARHHELDDVNDRITRAVKLRKNLDSLKKMLEPAAPMHRKRDLDELKKAVMKVQSLAKELDPAEFQPYQQDLNIAITGIIERPQVRKPTAKPELNVEDLE